jgi:arginyl-tRNA synthetase
MDTKSLSLLNLPIEREIKCMLAFYKHILQTIANNYEVHRLCNYLQQLAKLYHSYYTSNKIIDEVNLDLSSQRLTLSVAVKQVLASGLKLLKITPSDRM